MSFIGDCGLEPFFLISRLIMPLFLNFEPFSHSNLLLFCLSVSSLTSHQLMGFSEIFQRFFQGFQDFSRFYEILWDSRYFSFSSLSSRVKNYICILWNPNICSNNNINNNNNNNNSNNNNMAIVEENVQTSLGLFLTSWNWNFF